MKGPAALGGIGAAAKTSLSEIQFSKGTDSATTPLMRNATPSKAGDKACD
jgi:hypothetical protein